MHHVSIGDVFWLFIIVTSLQPIFRQKIIESARLKLLQALERTRKTRVISLIHRQEVMAILGFPLVRYISVEDSEEVLRAIRMTDPQTPIDLILHTPGGMVLAAEQIAHALARHQAKVTVFVPHYAMSGGTLLSLVADAIVMDPDAVLGPIDPQIGEHPAASLLAAVKRKPVDKIDDATLVLADVAEKAVRQVRELARTLLARRRPPEDAERIADLLTRGEWTHDYPITVDEARRIGLDISTEMPVEVYQLMNLYPQPASKRPSVLYVPTQRDAKPPATHAKR
jgi:ClpP class serine protease